MVIRLSVPAGDVPALHVYDQFPVLHPVLDGGGGVPALLEGHLLHQVAPAALEYPPDLRLAWQQSEALSLVQI